MEKGGGGQEAEGEKDASDIMCNNIGVMRNLEPFCGGLQEKEEEEETGVITYALRSGRSCKRQKIHLRMHVTGYLSRSSLLPGFWIGDRQLW